MFSQTDGGHEERMSREERQQHARATTKRAILDAALALFVSDGYAQVSIRNIAAKVDYSPAAIYSYFPSKDDIFFALAEEGFRLLGAAQLPRSPSDDPLDDIRSAAARFYEFSKAQPQYFALVFLDRRVPRIGREYERFAFMSDLKSRLEARMQHCIDQGIFPATVDAEVALRLLWAPILGIAALRLSERLPHAEADALVLDAIDTTIAGLRAGAPSRARRSTPCVPSQPAVVTRVEKSESLT
jgi:AcrR family transcriptional regulator